MPRQVGDLTKFERISMLMEIMKELGRANPGQIYEKLLRTVGAEANAENLKRMVYRDLKELATSGKVNIEYIAPDGRRLTEEPEEGELKNFRVEYFVEDQKDKTLGYELLQSHGGTLCARGASQVHWRISDTLLKAKSSDRGLAFEASLGEFLILSAPAEELPFKVLIARQQEDRDLEPSVISRLQKEFGGRTSVLFLKERHLSRLSVDQQDDAKWGHVLISFQGDGSICAQDLGSTTGTFWTPMTTESKRFIERRTVANRAVATFIPSEASLFQEMNWKEIKGETRLESPVVLRAGKVLISLF